MEPYDPNLGDMIGPSTRIDRHVNRHSQRFFDLVNDSA